MPSTPERATAPTAAPVADWQVRLLLKARWTPVAFRTSRHGATLIEEHAGRPLGSLRDLTSEEALQVIDALGRSTPQAQTGSSWDEREDDTWIDRL